MARSQRKKILSRWQTYWILLWFVPAFFFMGFHPLFSLENVLKSPSLFHPLGFDAFGRDLFRLVLHASGLSGLFASLAVLTAITLGFCLGPALALLPARLSVLGNRVLDFFVAFPSLIFALTVAAILGPGFTTLWIALLLGCVPDTTRFLYTRSEELLKEDFILAAQSLGASKFRLIRTHLFPALWSSIRVKIPNLFAGALLAEATLSYLGVGAPIGRDTWGSLLIQAQDYLFEAPHVSFGVGIPLFLTLLALLTWNEK